MICEQNHQDLEESIDRKKGTVKKLVWPEKGFCVGFLPGIFSGGGVGNYLDHDQNTYAGGDSPIQHPFGEGNTLFQRTTFPF